MNQAPKDSHNYKHMPNICQRYARSDSEATNSRQLPKANICQRYAKICQRYARSNSEATNSRQLPKANIRQRYTQIWQSQLTKALDPQAVKAITAVKF